MIFYLFFWLFCFLFLFLASFEDNSPENSSRLSLREFGSFFLKFGLLLFDKVKSPPRVNVLRIDGVIQMISSLILR